MRSLPTLCIVLAAAVLGLAFRSGQVGPGLAVAGGLVGCAWLARWLDSES